MSVFSQALNKYQNNITTLKEPKQWLLESIGGKTRSGMKVNERLALTLSAYYDGVNLLANHIAYLPFQIIQQDLNTGNRTKRHEHEIYDLMNWEANSSYYGGMTAFTFKKTMTLHMLNWGDAFSLIHRGGGGIRELELIEPWRGSVIKDRATKSIWYDFDDYENYFPARDVLHLHQFSLDGVRGLSIIQAGARERFGGHLAVEQYGETFFGQGTHMGGLLTTEESLGNDPKVVNQAKSEIRQELENVYGGPENWNKIGILDGKWQYKNLTLPAADAQLLERSKATVEDIARWLGVPPTKLKDTSSQNYNNREHEAIDYVQDGLMPRTEIWQQETRRKLLREREKRDGYETIINVKDLMRGDLQSMAEFLREMVDRAIFTPNQALEFMGEDTYEGGDVHLMPLNFTTLEKFEEGVTENEAEQLIQSLKRVINNRKNGHEA